MNHERNYAILGSDLRVKYLAVFVLTIDVWPYSWLSVSSL